MRDTFVEQAIDLTDGGYQFVLCLVLAAREMDRRAASTAICEELVAKGVPKWSVIRTGNKVIAGNLLFVVCPPTPQLLMGLEPTLVVYGRDGYTPEADQYLRNRPGVRFY